MQSSEPVSGEALRRMSAAVRHRGPDDDGVYLEADVGLGHRRLSILDISGGHQPWLDDETRRVMVYNGEIYNFRELRTKYTRHGERFKSDCDTEVLCRIFDGSSFEWIHELNGMFAFALWEGRTRDLYLVRDRLGIKPLYYTIHQGHFYFASEIKALFAAGVPLELDHTLMPEYLVFRYIPGNVTMYKNIFSVPPGHYMRLRAGGSNPSAVRYWEATPKRNHADPDLPVERQLEDILKSSISYRMVSDVPVGTYNSGGVDSSLITAWTRGLSNGELHTFSVGFEEESHDESRYAAEVAKQLGTDHHKVVINAHQYADGFEAALRNNDQPLFQPHTVQLHCLSKVAKQFVTVVLTGEGADEVFAGYPRYQIPLVARRLTFVPGWLSSLMLAGARGARMRRLEKLCELLAGPDQPTLENARFVSRADFAAAGFGPIDLRNRLTILENVRRKGLSELESLLEYDRSTYLPGLIERLDRTTMANGVEARVPFLDYRLVEWSMTLPRDVKIKVGFENKVILKRVAARIFPKEMIYRRKVGFGLPLDQWFRDPHGMGRYLDLIIDQTCRERGFYDCSKIETIIDRHRQGATDQGELLWSLINFELWCRMSTTPSES